MEIPGLQIKREHIGKQGVESTGNVPNDI